MSAEVEIEFVAFTLAYGNAQPDDTHLAADVVAIDGEIIEVLAERERRRRKRKERRCRSR
jgi:hypothetical protein